MMQKLEIECPKGNSPTCIKCGNWNAMLDDWARLRYGDGEIVHLLVCRDCGFAVTYDSIKLVEPKPLTVQCKLVLEGQTLDEETRKRVNQKSNTRWYAHVDLPQPHLIKGCPMGREETKEGAIEDLRYRVRIESKVELEFTETLIRDLREEK